MNLYDVFAGTVAGVGWYLLWFLGREAWRSRVTLGWRGYLGASMCLFCALLLIPILASCSAAQPVTKDATCSPQADVWYAQELATVCSGKPLTECPEADAVGDAYEDRALKECE